MKKVLIGLAVLIVLVVAGVLLAPSFIDWNQYKGVIAQKVEQATGRQLAIGGDLSLSVLPRVALEVEDVRLASLPGARDEAFLSVDTVEVRVDPAALLSGDVRVQSVRLVRPVVALERLEDGTATWDFTTSATQGAADVVAEGTPAEDPAAAGSGDGGVNLRLDQVIIENGLVTYRDASGTEERLATINAELAADSLNGPFRAEGSMAARGVPLFVKAVIGELAANKASPLSAEIALQEAAATARFTGLLTSADQDPGAGRTVRGDLTLSASNLRAAAHAFGVALPPGVAAPFRLGGELAVSPREAGITGLTVALGDSEATGGLSVDYGAQPMQADLKLAFGTLNADRWTGAAGSGQTGAAPPTEPPKQPGPQAVPMGGDIAFALPADLAATVDITAEAVTWRDGVVRQVVAQGTLADGTLSFSDISAQLPGNSTLRLQGTLTTPEAVPTLDLAVAGRSDNLRGVLEWLGTDVSAVPGGRLGRFKAEASVGGTLREVTVRSLDATIDTTSLRGAATIRPGLGGERPAVGATVRVGSLNLDAYRTPHSARAASAGPSEPPPPADAKARQQKPEEPLFAGLGFLNDFDANLRADLETLTLRDVPLHDVKVDLALLRGVMTFKDTGVGQALGASAKVSGGLGGFGGAPRFQKLTYALRAPDAGRLARAFAVPLPVPAAQLGQVALDGTLDGTLDSLKIDTDSRLANTAVAVEGTLTDVLGAPGADVAVQAAHPDTARLIALLAPDVRLAGPLGALSFQGKVTAREGSVAVSGMTLGVGDTRVQGDVTADLAAAPRPQVTATLRANSLPLDAFLPAEQQAWLEPVIAPLRARLIPAAYVPGRPLVDRPALSPAQAAKRPAANRRQAAPGPWSREPLDLSALGLADAQVSLEAGEMTLKGVVLRQARINAMLEDSTLTFNQLAGSLFGGSLNGTATVAAKGQAPAVSIALEGAAVQVGQALSAMTGKASADGVAAFTTTLNGGGASTFAIAQSLAGSGSLTIDRLNVAAGGQKGAGQALLGPVAALNQLAAVGAGRDSLAQMATTYTVDKGIATFQTLKVDSALYNGQFQGVVNLPRWTLDIQGQAKLAPNLLTTLLGSKVKLPEVIPVSVTGSIEDPTVRVQTGQAGGGAAGATTTPSPLPASPEGAAKQILDQVLGGGRKQEQQAPPKGGEEQQKQQKQEPKPEDILRGILQGLPKQ